MSRSRILSWLLPPILLAGGCTRVSEPELRHGRGLVPLVWEIATGEQRASDRVQELFSAVQQGDIPTVQAMVWSGVPLQGLNGEGYDLVEAAIRAGQGEMLEFLLTKGAVPEHGDAVVAALTSARPDLIYQLLDHHIELNIWTRDGLTPLIFAVLTGDPEIVKTLIEHGALAGFTSRDGREPLSFAGRKDNLGNFPDPEFNYGEIRQLLNGEAGL